LNVLCSLRFGLREQSPACAIHGYGARRREMRFNASRFIRLAHGLPRGKLFCPGAHDAR